MHDGHDAGTPMNGDPQASAELLAARPSRRGPAKTGKVNIRDIAEKAGVSSATVSNVMRGAPNVSERTRKRVMQVVDELGYVPNAHALALTTPPNSVTLVVRAIAGGTYADMMSGVEREVTSRHMTFRLISTGLAQHTMDQVVNDLLSQRPKVAVVSADSGSDQEQDVKLAGNLRQFDNVGTKVVVLGRPRLTLPERIGVVDYTNERGMYEMTRYMISMGHTRFLYMGIMHASSVFHARYQGFLRALREAGIEHDPQYDTERFGDRADNVSDLLSRYHAGARFTAVVAATDSMALDAIVALRGLGLSVPDQVSVSGFDDMPYAEDLCVPLSTVHVPFLEMGRVAVRIGMGERENDVIMPTELAIRRSIMPPDPSVLER
ncbi:LacI family transcriptional regulator [Bifidobacterium amazonense]|uniref:LacI family transcriptional regulator n=1 Tax=Bifidobacterium amazonense TaxID=2809027 RepID=A0ABS9VW77_9BIFI|nr:LacI family DNA-binding transcriptional regulator [Bifidobacterium amazonense]MCH9276065.1 LacI family transcriptional regulator [Bifidobacterium amazonense]